MDDLKDSSSESSGMDGFIYDDWADLIYDEWEDLHAADASQLGPLFTPEESKEIDALLKSMVSRRTSALLTPRIKGKD
ncbi:hypothetical protein COL516b_002492 [Colletotrichum fioriniae]|nr:uncharacterized protein COL516b_002492 [Colletotrichum fioriniae]KAJ0309987.1 hypothetical protein COL516b_002492 [Colletotrichum fioriniae]